MSAEPSGWILRNLRGGTGKPWLTEADSDAYKMAASRDDYSCEPVYDRATLDAAVAAAQAEERAAWQPAISLAQQCIEAAYNDRWPEFDRLSDEFDDACADAVLRLKPDAAAIRDLKPEGE